MRSLHELINIILKALCDIKLEPNCTGNDGSLHDILKKYIEFLCEIDIDHCFDEEISNE